MSKAKRKPKKVSTSKPVVLEMRNVSFASRTAHSIGFRHVDLVLREGELTVMRIGRSNKCRDVASMLQGLHQPTEGEILFRNQNWLGNDYNRHYRMRSQIGRVFEDHAWIQHFNVLENVMLAGRHHRLATTAVELEVKSWTERLNVASVAYDRPAFVDPPVLQVYQWIRAMICKPALLILERPMNFVPLDRDFRTYRSNQ